MSINSRDPLRHHIDPGPYLGIVTSQLDPTYMGSLRVNITRSSPEQDDVVATGVIVRYCSPFFGATSQRYEGNNSSSFNDVQKSYGFWMVPPDVGCTVLVTFVGGDINQGYWFGCVPDRYQDQMVPGIAASQYSAMTEEQRRQYGTQNVPVAEFLKSSRDMNVPDPNKFTKPVHPFADRLVQQGLLIDDVRGVTSSSARREAPSSVYGISTPGPVDTSSPLKPAGFPGDGDAYAMPVSRLGGHQFVMDDGDKDGKNELFRIRTRTGHQILLHNSSDLIYIANSKGTAWIELTSNGKIDMYAEDSVSIHTLQDFNFLAERDINIESKRDMNMSVGGNYHIDVKNNYIVNVSQSGQLTFESDLDVLSNSTIAMTAAGDLHLSSSDVFCSSSGALNLNAGAALNGTAGASFNVLAGAPVNITGSTIEMGATTNFKSQTNLQGTDPQGGIVMPIKGTGAGSASAAGSATPAQSASDLPIFTLPNRVSGSGWANQQFYKTDDIITIMKRAPTHEPWDHHENINPDAYSSVGTDISTGGGSATVDYRIPPAVGVPPKKTGNVEQDNIASFLWTIRNCEGTAGGNGYQEMFTGKHFSITDPSLPTYQWKSHPNIANKATVRGRVISSTAAGAYQFLFKTWTQLSKSLGLKDFTPASQDKAAVLLLKQCGALEYVKRGNIPAATAKATRIWASLPGNNYNQGGKSLAAVEAYFKQGGGTLNA